MSTDLVLADDGLTVEFEGGDEHPDLTPDEAEAVTGRIRRWVNDFPVEDVVLAFRGRIWIALAYESWSEWCECELGGLKLPAPKRREVVSELTEAGMSGEAIADALDVSNATVSRDRTLTNVRVGRDGKSLGQDGRERSHPQPKADVPQPETVDAEIVCRDCDGYGCETCYPADEPDVTEKPEPKPVPVPTPKAPAAKGKPDIVVLARNLGLDIAAITNRVEKLGADDRLVGKKNEVAPKLRHHLEQLIKVCQDLNQQLTPGA